MTKLCGIGQATNVRKRITGAEEKGLKTRKKPSASEVKRAMLWVNRVNRPQFHPSLESPERGKKIGSGGDAPVAVSSPVHLFVEHQSGFAQIREIHVPTLRLVCSLSSFAASLIRVHPCSSVVELPHASASLR